MAHIVELREMSDEQLEERLENAREELFNLRFQQASARLEDTSRLRFVRREIAQMKEVLHKRRLAVDAAAETPEIAAVLSGKRWDARTRYIYEDSAWDVTFFDGDGNEIASAMVNLNQKRRPRQGNEQKPGLVKSYDVTG
jgi:large subunit ribosomal protein L29